MFTIAGILADEEPKTPVSASGNYNTSRYTGWADSFLSDVLWSGRSEFTLMCWVNLATGATSETVYMEDFVDSYFEVSNNKVLVRIKNSNGGVTTKSISITNNLNEWYHWTITGSVSNNRLRIYRNGVLIGSSVMAYANATFTTSRINNDSFDFAQFNFYDNELSEEEVLEHYVYDEDLMQSGVLGYDAMTASQRSGLLYSSSFIDSISFSGNEFKDRSGNDISLSINPPLTGQQIYVYTDASDLPSDEPNAFAPSVATLDGSNYLQADSALTVGTQQSMSIWIKTNVLQADLNAFDMNFGTGLDANAGPRLEVNGSGATTLYWNGTGGVNGATFGTISSQEWYHILYTCDAGEFKTYLNGSLVSTVTSTVGYNQTYDNMAFGVGFNSGRTWADGAIVMPMVFNKIVSSTEIDELYNEGSIPCYGDLSTTLTDDCVYAPNLMTFNGRTEASAIVDNSSSGITATWTGTATYEPTGALIVSDGDVQYAVTSSDFDDLSGATDVNCGNDSALQFTTDFTVGLSVLVDDTDPQFFISKWQSANNNRGWAIALGSIGVFEFKVGGGSSSTNVSTSVTPNTGQWYRVVATVDSSNGTKVYVDGSEVGSAPAETSVYNASSIDVLIGAANGSSPVVIANGSLFDAFIMSRVMTTDEITADYNNGVATCYDDKPTAITDDTVLNISLGNWNGETGSEFTDNSSISNTITNNGITIDRAEGLTIECDEDPV